jgi:hypothetical protein
MTLRSQAGLLRLFSAPALGFRLFPFSGNVEMRCASMASGLLQAKAFQLGVELRNGVYLRTATLPGWPTNQLA